MHVTQTINLYFSAQTRRRESAGRGFPWAHVRGGTEASLIWCKPLRLHFLAKIQPHPWGGPPLPKSVWLFVTASVHPGSCPQVPSGPWAPCVRPCTQLPFALTGGRGNVSHAKSVSSDSGLCFGEKNTFKKGCEFIPRQQCK